MKFNINTISKHLMTNFISHLLRFSVIFTSYNVWYDIMKKSSKQHYTKAFWHNLKLKSRISKNPFKRLNILAVFQRTIHRNEMYLFYNYILLFFFHWVLGTSLKQHLLFKERNRCWKRRKNIIYGNKPWP